MSPLHEKTMQPQYCNGSSFCQEEFIYDYQFCLQRKCSKICNCSLEIHFKEFFQNKFERYERIINSNSEIAASLQKYLQKQNSKTFTCIGLAHW